MPNFKITSPEGKVYNIKGPEGSTREQALAKLQAKLNVRRPPPTLPVVPTLEKEKRPHGLSYLDRAVYGGVQEPLTAAAQMAYNALPSSVQKGGNWLNNKLSSMGMPLIPIPPEGFNKQVSDIHQDYMRENPDARFDAGRLSGNIATAIGLTRNIKAGSNLKSMAKSGAKAGGVLGPLQPVYDYDKSKTRSGFWKEKGKQAGMGAGMGVAAAPVGLAFSRIINPKMAHNVDIQRLQKAGVEPTIGSVAGKTAARTEEKLQSVPFLGDAITAARNRAKEQFNVAAINKALAPIKKTVTETGYDAVYKAQQMVKNSYDEALDAIGGVKLDARAKAMMTELDDLSSGLSKDMQRAYQRFMADRVRPMISPVGGMHSITYKTVDSELRKKAARYGRGSAMEQELGDLFTQMRDIFKQQIQRTNPQAGHKLKAADKAYAGMVRIEKAVNKSVTEDGVFTPGQLMGGIRAADETVRKRGFAGGRAMMQQLARSGQKQLGNRYADSGTVGRLLLDAGGLATGLISPFIPASLIGSSMLYTRPVQKALVDALTKRPEMAGHIAQLIRQSTPGAALPMAGLLGPE